MTLATWQGSYNGITFGGASDYTQIVSVEGWLDLPDLASGDEQRPRSVGLLSGLDLPAGRTITLSLEVVAALGLTLPDTLDQVSAAFQTSQSTELPLELYLPGVYGDRLSYCRTRKRSSPVDVGFSGGLAVLTVQLVASDPRIYAAAGRSMTVNLPVPSSGMTFPATFALTFGGTTGGGGSIAAVNSGNYDAPWKATITGPCMKPRIQKTSTGETVSVNMTLGSTDQLVLDSAAETILFNGSAYRSDVLNQSDWFALDRLATTDVGFFSSDPSATAATIALSWSDTWL